MPPKTSNDNRQDQDSINNPGQRQANELLNNEAWATHTLDQMEAGLADPNDSAEAVRRKEQQARFKQARDENPLGYVPSDKPSGNLGPDTIMGKLKGFMGRHKKKGPLAGVAALLGIGGFTFSMVLAPGLGILHISEIFDDDLNDNIAAMQVRNSHVFKMKLKSMQGALSICGDKVSIRCKYSSMNDKMYQKMTDPKKGGQFTIECFRNPCKPNALGRYTDIKSIKAPSGEVFDGRPDRFMRHAMTDLKTMNAMRKLNNPFFTSVVDSAGRNALAKLGIKPKPTPISGDRDADDKAVRARVQTVAGVAADNFNNVSADENNVSEEEADKANRTGSEIDKQVKEAKESGTKMTTGAVKNVGRSVGALGYIDSLCTLYRTGHIVSQTSKAVKGAQVAAFAIESKSVASKIQAGEGDDKEVSYWGGVLTDYDTNKQIPDPNDDSGKKMIDNPHYQKNAFDSDLYKTAAYGDAPKLDARSAQYTVGGSSGILGMIDMAMIKGDAAIETCNVVQHWAVRSVSIITGVALGIASGGGTLALSAGASVAVWYATSVAQAMLIDILSGNVIGDSTRGSEAGSAIFSGTAYIHMQTAMKRGLRPLKKGQVASYMGLSKDIKNDFIAMETEEAKATPFDVYNRYSFMGSMARDLAVITLSSDNIIGKTTALARLPLASVTKKASASTPFNMERLDRCDDPLYNERDLAADVACNVRYGLTPAELNMDAEQVLNFMIDGGYVDDETGEASGDYAKYIESCIDRDAPLGPQGLDGSKEDEYTKGEVCYSDDPMFMNFRVYHVDSTIHAILDEDPIVLSGAAASDGDDGSGDSNGDGRATGDFLWPVDPDKSTGVAMSRCYIPGTYQSGHLGIDIALSEGGTILAADGGEVILSANMPAFGNVVGIKHKDRLFTTYMHNNQLLVKKGDKVSKGQEIAKSGSTGNSTGPHLHFEISNMPSSTYWSDTTNTYDPLDYVNIPAGTPGKTTAVGCR